MSTTRSVAKAWRTASSMRGTVASALPGVGRTPGYGGRIEPGGRAGPGGEAGMSDGHVTITRLYTGDDGRTHFEDLEVPLTTTFGTEAQGLAGRPVGLL